MLKNPIINNLPKHLQAFIIDQNYQNYTSQDHSVWRYVMRQNINFLGKYAHSSYLEGLQKTGISVEKIPSIEEMNQILERIGWAAVTVDGFIPPAAFMEFQKHNVLVIAADIRAIDQIEYTPAPDIIHEAAGHAPIIADAEYATYLRNFGEIGSKAFSSAKDYEMYEAIRHLSILKANPNTPKDKIKIAEKLLSRLGNKMGLPSEMAQIRNLHWWTVEYGLIGKPDNPKIYGAGLLSSIGESVGAMKDDVLKIPYSIDAIDFNFDITKPQPQLFVTPDFQNLNYVLEQFSSHMALKRGGTEGILKAIESGNPATLEYTSGIQVCGIFTELVQKDGQPIYIRTKGPTILCYSDKVLDGQTKEHHSDGFGSPVGRIKGFLKPTRLLTHSDLVKLGIEKGKVAEFEFESGVQVRGELVNSIRKDGKLLLISFKNCSVKYEDRLLFDESWGIYDMAIGEKISSCFNGPADPLAFGLEYTPPEEKTIHIQYSEEQRKIHELYGHVRKIRENGTEIGMLPTILSETLRLNQNEWLLILEILELSYFSPSLSSLKQEVSSRLNEMKSNTEFQKLITNGMELITSGSN